MTAHAADCGCDTYGCRLRRKGLQVSPQATPNRRRWAYRQPKAPQWEKGRVGEPRPGGSFMPYLSPRTGKPIGVKEYAENRGNFEAQVKALHGDPTVLSRSRAAAAKE